MLSAAIPMRLKRLQIAELPDVPVLDPDDEGGVCWEYPNGKPMVVAKAIGEWCWVWVSSMATFRFPLVSPDLDVSCVAVPHPRAKTTTIVDGYYRMVMPMILQVYGLESMHGTAVTPPPAAAAGDAGAYTFHAFSTGGKTTLTRALVERGFTIHADDALIIDAFGARLATPRPALQPIPFALRLREPSAELFGLPVRQKIEDPGELDEDDLPAALPLAGMVLIERVEGDDVGGTELTLLSPNAAFKRLLDHCYTFDPFRKERTARMMKAYLKLAREVPVVHFRYPSGLDRLPEVASALAARLVAGLA